MANPLTLMAVHAHPDDESIGTGGVLAQAAADGFRTVLVTCTGGEVGEIAPETGVEPELLAEVRRRELERACEILGVRHLEMLGYRDSGMMGALDNHHPEAFHQANLNDAIARLVTLVRTYQPDIIVTYDENGFYGHPDHINAHRVAVGAFHRAGDPLLDDGHPPHTTAKLYYTAIGQSQFVEFGRRLHELGIDGPGGRSDGDAEAAADPQADAAPAAAAATEEAAPTPPPWGIPDQLITTVVDVSAHVSKKREALWAHATQMGPEVFFARLPDQAFDSMFGREQFRLVQSRVPVSLPETDLFAGLR
ncbi:MAG: PIG-L family deacetylase [Chloroflexi bacterium]|nr:PIG-L family deacetylase [Chloroflexota bacterium]